MNHREFIEKLRKQMRYYISPLFFILLLASFILWYMAKMNYTYTTEQSVRVNVDGVPFTVTCVVEGIGTNLFGYRAYSKNTVRIPLTELKYTRSREAGHENKIIIDPQSLKNAISIRFSDIKVNSIGVIPELDLSAIVKQP